MAHDQLDDRPETTPELSNNTDSETSAWWQRHWSWGAILLLGVVLYGSRPTELTIRGEESRRGRIAWEMINGQDWLVPRLMTEPWCSRPPLHYWTIAAAGVVRGQVDVIAVRAPSIIAVLLTTLLVFWYARTHQSKIGGIAAALAFLTFGQVLEIGRLGETEAVFTCLMAGSLLLWHGLRTRGYSPELYWTIGGGLAALAMLAKGPQAPVYFWGGIGIYLLWTRNLSELRRWQGPAAGLAAFLAIILAWHIPFIESVGWQYVQQIYFGEVESRFGDRDWGSVIEHLAVYPFAILLACLMPWSPLLLAFANPRFLPHVRPYRDQIAFLTLIALFAFVPVWLPPNSNPRYYMPMYPLIAVLIGMVVDRLFATARTEYWQELWPRYLAALSICFVGLSVAGLVMGFGLEKPVVSVPFALVYSALLIVSADVLRRLRNNWNIHAVTTALFLIAGIGGLTSVGLVTSALKEHSENAPAVVAAIKRELPPDARLRGFGLVNHLFLFHYPEQIRLEPIPEATNAEVVASAGRYFCITVKHGQIPELPFAWEPIGVVSCDRTRRPKPREQVLVGRITPNATTSDVVPLRSTSDLPNSVIR